MAELSPLDSLRTILIHPSHFELDTVVYRRPITEERVSVAVAVLQFVGPEVIWQPGRRKGGDDRSPR
jgi:hypothetical protein